ncbi:rotatin-like isoform X3 [Homarus americanus]|nr:rotatin-like isoform X3 [Homarus americanus]
MTPTLSEFNQVQVEEESQRTTSNKNIETNYIPIGHHRLNIHETGGSVAGSQCVGSFCDMTLDEHPVVHQEPSVTFTTFPWQALTGSDRRVLDSTTQSLLSHNEAVVVASLHFLDTVVLKDFPAEVILQRPAVVQAVYGCIEEEGENAWRVQGPACNCLLTLTQLVSTRVKHFTDPHLTPGEEQITTPTSSELATPNTDTTRGSCCSSQGDCMQSLSHLTKGKSRRQLGDGQDKSGSLSNVAQELSGTTIHEEDDGDEFILLGMHQLTVTGHCSRIMRVVCPLLVSPRPSIQAASLHLLTACLTLLLQCVQPKLLWEQENGDEVVLEIRGEIRKVIRCISYLIMASYEAKNLTAIQTEAEKQILNIHCLSLVLCRILVDFIPLEASSQVIDGDVSEGLMLVLYDGGFYFEYNNQHNILLQYLSQVKSIEADQFRCVLFATKGLQATARFLQTSSSQLEEFLDLAVKSLSVSSVHQSTVFVEKFVRGMAKQIAIGCVNEEQLDKARNLLLQILQFPDVTVRLSGYKSVMHLMEDSVGISQAVDSSMSRSPRILFLLSSTIIRCLLYCGLVDDNKEVVKVAEDILLGLLLGYPLMSTPVWTVAAECWRVCLPDLQCVAESTTKLGRAVANLPLTVYEDDRTLQKIEHLRYWLQCLYTRDKDTRIQALSRVIQRLVLTAADFLLDPQDFHLGVHHDLFIVKNPIHLLLSNNMASEEGRLMRILELIQGRGVEPGVCKAAWSQLAFLLEDPQLHQPFFKLCSLQFLVMNFINMVKRDGSPNLTVEYLPGAVETLRLIATHSNHIRTTLLQDEEFLLCIVRVALFYYVDDRTRCQASCLMALLIFNHVIIFAGTDECQKQVTVHGKNFISVPELLTSRVHLPFICDIYPWYERSGLCHEMRTVHHILKEKDWAVLDFLKTVWAAAFAGGVEHIDCAHVQSSKFSANLDIGEYETTLLKSSVLKLVMTKILLNIENATSHQDVKRNVNNLGFYIQQVQFTSCKNEIFLTSSYWNQSLQRFLTSQPNSSVDEQLLTHILNSVSVSLLVYRPFLKGGVAVYPQILQLLLNELKNQDSALHYTLQRTGGVNWVASDPNPRALMSIRLFRAATNLMCQTLKFVCCNVNCQDIFGSSSWNQLATSITTSLLPLLSANNDLQYYNLAVLGCSLECLVYVTALGWPGEDLAHQLVSSLIRLISTFHIGRGRAHNSYMGRMVTLCSSLALVHLLSNHPGDLTQDITTWSSEEGFLDWSWLVSLWVYRDPSVTSTGLMIAAALTTQARGLSLLHNSLTQVSGGVWGAALSYLMSSGRSCIVRTSAAQLLIKLTQTGPTASNPWISPIVADTITGESVEGLAALMVLFQHCNLYSVVHSSLSKLYVSHDQLPVNARLNTQGELDLSMSRLSSFYLINSDDHNNKESQSDENSYDDNTTSTPVSVQLYETLLRLLVNIVLLQPSQVIPQMSSHGIISLVVKQLRFTVSQIKISMVHLQAVETSLVLIGAVLKHDPEQAPLLARDTNLVHLTLAVLSSGTDWTSIIIVSLEILNALICGGSWGAVRIIQWIAVSPALTLHPIVAGLHVCASLELQTATAAFLSNLLSQVFLNEISLQQDLQSTVSGILDVPVQILNNQSVCPGWELSRHIIQLMCDLPDCEDPNKQNSRKHKAEVLGIEKEHLCLLLDCLKLLLLVSQSAKEAAHHFRSFLIPFLSKPLSDLQVKLQTINIHITSQPMKKKEIKDDICTVIQHLEVVTNWVKGRGCWSVNIGESIIPLLHPLWVPALRTPPLLGAVLRFLLTASAHYQVCLFMTRTSGMPGVLLSTSRTKRPLLACITTTVCQQLGKLLTCSRGFALCFDNFSRVSFLTAISILLNCARVQECAYVMNKLDLVSLLIKWLQSKMATDEGMSITPSTMKLLVLLTTHHESQITVCKSYGWVNTIHDLVLHDGLQKDALRIMANMSLNHHSAHSLFTSDGFIKTIIGIITDKMDEPWSEVALVILWALISNNQRGQAVMKQHPLIPLLKHLTDSQDVKKASLSQKILDILS